MSPLHLKTVLKQVQNLSLSPLFHSLSLHPLSYVSVSVCVLSVYTWKLKAEVRCLPLLCSPCWFTRWGLSLNSGSFSLCFLVIGLQVGNTYLFFFLNMGVGSLNSVLHTCVAIVLSTETSSRPKKKLFWGVAPREMGTEQETPFQKSQLSAWTM